MEDRTCLCLYCIASSDLSAQKNKQIVRRTVLTQSKTCCHDQTHLVELVGVRHRINLEWDLAGKHFRVSHSEQRPIGDSFTPNVR
jgi:hypothetical protein